MASIAPALHAWFTTEYLVENPAEAKKLRELERLVMGYRTQGADARIDAFMRPVKQVWTANMITGRLARWYGTKWVDLNLPLLYAMQDAQIDRDTLEAKDDPLLLVTAHSQSASSKAAHAVLRGTTDLAGTKTGESLQDALRAISEQGDEAIREFERYAVARRALLWHERGMQSGISQEDAEATVAKYESDAFRETLDRVTAWSHRMLGLLVESGSLTQAEYDQIVEKNPVYVPFSRQLDEADVRADRGGGKGGKKGVYRAKGDGHEIHDPLVALIWQAEQIAATAMQADVLRAVVNLYDNNQGGKGSIAHLLSEVDAPTEATTFSAEQIKRQMGEKAVELGADPDMVAAAMMDAWTETLTVFTRGTQYKGSGHIVSIVIDGNRRFFEVKPEMYNLLTGLNKQGNITGWLGKVSRGAVSLQRMGATGLNPAFGLIRNFMRDALTASVTYEYAKGGPLAAAMGVIEDLRGSEMEERFKALGIELAGWIGQDRRKTKGIRRKMLATTGTQATIATVLTPIEGMRALFGVTEVGPRLAEFKAAYNAGMKKYGDEKNAAVLAAVAAKDVTVNFTRAGEYGRVANEICLFFNAAVQSLDKFGRTWKTNPGRTAARGLGWITLSALLAYLQHRDEEWWKELPAYEKWSYIHWAIPGTDVVLRAPLPFEFGAAFGALPVAMLEESRTPGAFMEAATQVMENAAPIQVTKDGKLSLHAIFSNVAAASPAIDILANEDWKGSTIVPEYVSRHRVPAEHYKPRTTEMAKIAGRMVGHSPAKLEHLVNQYTGGLYRRVAWLLETAADPSGISLKNPSSWPLAGTLFLRPNTSRVTQDFYDRLNKLKQLAGSNQASLAEIGELTAARRLDRSLAKMWATSRDAMASGQSKGTIKAETGQVIQDIQAAIREHQALSEEAHRQAGIAAVVYAATNPSAEPADIEQAATLLADLSRDEKRAALRRETKLRGHKIGTKAYQQRIRRLR